MYFPQEMSPPRTTYVVCIAPDERFILTRLTNGFPNTSVWGGWDATLSKTSNMYPSDAYDNTMAHVYKSARSLLFTSFNIKVDNSDLEYICSTKTDNMNVYGLIDVSIIIFESMVTLIASHKREVKAVREEDLRNILKNGPSLFTVAAQNVIYNLLDREAQKELLR